MRKVVINSCYGGFGLSPKAQYEFLKRKYGTVYAYKMKDWTGVRVSIDEFLNKKEFDFSGSVMLSHYDLGNEFDERDYKDDTEHPDLLFSSYNNDIEFRSDPILVEVVEEMMDDANGYCARLSVVEIPDDADVEIEEYDGNETVVEKHRRWC